MFVFAYLTLADHWVSEWGAALFWFFLSLLPDLLLVIGLLGNRPYRFTCAISIGGLLPTSFWFALAFLYSLRQPVALILSVSFLLSHVILARLSYKTVRVWDMGPSELFGGITGIVLYFALGGLAIITSLSVGLR
jgi:hypothetical protein